jgi:hypothetical protein
MYIKGLRVKNYKSFADSGTIEFAEGFNAIVGKNNSGKTAFFEGLRTTENPNNLHRDPSLRKDAASPPTSNFILTVYLTPQEVFDQLMGGGPHVVWIPHPLEGRAQHEIADRIFREEGVTITIPYRQGAYDAPPYPSHGFFTHDSRRNQLGFKVEALPDRQNYKVHDPSSSAGDDLGAIAAAIVQRKIFAFKAERLSISKISLSTGKRLTSDASNLPRALFEMQTSHDLWEEFNEHVNRILPGIRRVAVASPGGNDLEIRLWPVDPAERRDDLAFTLEQSGTGVGQVLSILCAAMTNERSVIGIDEPNNFLHPGAVKALVGILKRFEHQYIVTTHSLDAIATAKPKQVHIVEWDNCVSTLRPANLLNFDEHRRLLAELGVSLADVFGMDSVLWVEGDTEELCLPMIAQAAYGYTPATAVIVRVRSVSEVLDKKKSSDVLWDIYKRLSSTGGLVPTRANFLFDRDGRTPAETERLERESEGAIKFIGRRTYENYLLDVDLLLAEMNEEAAAHGTELIPEAEVIHTWLSANASKFAPKALWRGDVNDDVWKRDVNAPELLNALFKDKLTMEYRKTRHSPALTRRLLLKGGPECEELKAIVKERIG